MPNPTILQTQQSLAVAARMASAVLDDHFDDLDDIGLDADGVPTNLRADGCQPTPSGALEDAFDDLDVDGLSCGMSSHGVSQLLRTTTALSTRPCSISGNDQTPARAHTYIGALTIGDIQVQQTEHGGDMDCRGNKRAKRFRKKRGRPGAMQQVNAMEANGGLVTVQELSKGTIGQTRQHLTRPGSLGIVNHSLVTPSSVRPMTC